MRPKFSSRLRRLQGEKNDRSQTRYQYDQLPSLGLAIQRWQSAHPADTPILLPIHDAFDYVTKSLHSLSRHLPNSGLLILFDDASSTTEMFDSFDSHLDDRCFYFGIRSDDYRGYPAVINAIMDATHGNLLIVNADCEITEFWYQEMQSALQDISPLATASCFSNNGGILSAPDENSPTDGPPHGWTPDAYAKRIRERSSRHRPEIPAAVGHAWLLTRAAYNVCGPLDTDLRNGKGYGEEVSFSLRAVEYGFRNVLVDSTYIVHHGSESLSEAGAFQKLEPVSAVDSMFPYHRSRTESMVFDRLNAFCAAKDRSRLFPDTARIGVDLTDLPRQSNGSGVFMLNSCVALHKHFPQLRPIISKRSSKDHVATLHNLGLQPVIFEEILTRGKIFFDLVYRPIQFFSHRHFRDLKTVSDRVVFTLLDLIAYNSPVYHASWEDFQGYRDLQRMTVANCDNVAFLSETVMNECEREFLFRSFQDDLVSYLGVANCPEVSEVIRSKYRQKSSRIDVLRERDLSQDLIMIGTRFLHKNRVFALDLVDALIDLGWEGRLRLIGASPAHGSSEREEAARLSKDRIAQQVEVYDWIGDDEKTRLLAGSGLLIFPSIVEGFGIPPFEAAAVGRPAISSASSAMREVLPAEAQLLQAFDPQVVAVEVMELLSSPKRMLAIADEINRVAQRFTWTVSGERLSRVIDRSLGQPRRPWSGIV